MTAAAYVRQIRNQLGLKQTEFAEKLGVSKSYIEKIEARAKPCSRNFINKLKTINPEIDCNIFFTP